MEMLEQTQKRTKKGGIIFNDLAYRANVIDMGQLTNVRNGRQTRAQANFSVGEQGCRQMRL